MCIQLKYRQIGKKFRKCHRRTDTYSMISTYEDRKFLFFQRKVDGNTDIYWVDAKILEALKAEGVEVVFGFPGGVVTRPKVFARDKASGVRDALVDLLLLSRCRLIIGSHWSSFSETAAELGGARLEIVGGRS